MLGVVVADEPWALLIVEALFGSSVVTCVGDGVWPDDCGLCEKASADIRRLVDSTQAKNRFGRRPILLVIEVFVSFASIPQLPIYSSGNLCDSFGRRAQKGQGIFSHRFKDRREGVEHGCQLRYLEDHRGFCAGDSDRNASIRVFHLLHALQEKVDGFSLDLGAPTEINN